MFKRTRGFSLSEVLIALTVIGVVAAITVPNLMVNHQKEQTLVQLKKAYSDLSRAAYMSKIENGDPITWDYSLSHTTFFKKYLYPFIVLSSQTIKQAEEKDIKYYQTSGEVETTLLYMRKEGEILELNSGCQIFTYPLNYSGSASKYLRKCFAIDINGYKKPNKFGRDLFAYCIDANKGVIPHSWEDNEPSTTKKTRAQLKNSSSQKYNCSKKARGMWCAALIMTDGWQIKDDYPW